MTDVEASFLDLPDDSVLTTDEMEDAFVLIKEVNNEKVGDVITVTLNNKMYNTTIQGDISEWGKIPIPTEDL
ncbi:MAG: hypothetical protein QF704_05620 [Anaerolineales bacterium]|nr:hypothetical protein [Anaerolineales bacterium]MDP6770155.1 hypothetical protein [Anaerolineales bacterium]